MRPDLVCIHLYDRRESVLPSAGLLTVEDAETGELVEIDSSRESVRATFARESAQRVDELDAALLHSGVDLIRLHTGQDHAPVLQRFFETRRRR